MKTYGLFMVMFIVSMFTTFAVYKKATEDELLKTILALMTTYIVYKLIKEEENK